MGGGDLHKSENKFLNVTYMQVGVSVDKVLRPILYWSAFKKIF